MATASTVPSCTGTAKSTLNFWAEASLVVRNIMKQPTSMWISGTVYSPKSHRCNKVLLLLNTEILSTLGMITSSGTVLIRGGDLIHLKRQFLDKTDIYRESSNTTSTTYQLKITESAGIPDTLCLYYISDPMDRRQGRESKAIYMGEPDEVSEELMQFMVSRYTAFNDHISYDKSKGKEESGNSGNGKGRGQKRKFKEMMMESKDSTVSDAENQRHKISENPPLKKRKIIENDKMLKVTESQSDHKDIDSDPLDEGECSQKSVSKVVESEMECSKMENAVHSKQSTLNQYFGTLAEAQNDDQNQKDENVVSENVGKELDRESNDGIMVESECGNHGVVDPVDDERNNGNVDVIDLTLNGSNGINGVNTEKEEMKEMKEATATGREEEDKEIKEMLKGQHLWIPQQIKEESNRLLLLNGDVTVRIVYDSEEDVIGDNGIGDAEIEGDGSIDHQIQSIVTEYGDCGKYWSHKVNSC